MFSEFTDYTYSQFHVSATQTTPGRLMFRLPSIKLLHVLEAGEVGP
jgi:hypothetical protein